jgi:hypothetical protein
MTYAWVEVAPGRMRYRKVRDDPPAQRSAFPCPRLVRAFASPVQSMADGKFYDDPASLRATYKASNNPHGVDFIEVGNEDVTKFTPPKRDRKADRDAIDRAISEVESGNAPPLLTQLPG